MHLKLQLLLGNCFPGEGRCMSSGRTGGRENGGCGEKGDETVTKRSTVADQRGWSGGIMGENRGFRQNHGEIPQTRA